MKRYIIILVIPFLLAGCSYFNGTRLEGLLGANENLISLSYKIAENLETNAFPPLIPRNPDQPLLVTTFVDNNDLNRTSRFGRILQEDIASRFVQLGYTIKEIEFRKNLFIRKKSGEVMLSRDLNLIDPTLSAQAVVVGTYTYTNRTMYISARLINPRTADIIASADYRLIMDKNVLAMFNLKMIARDDPYQPIKKPKESIIDSIFY